MGTMNDLAAVSVCASAPGPGVAVAQVRGFDDSGRVLLEGLTDDGDGVMPARTTVALSPSAIGSAVVVVFESGMPSLPIVIGVIQSDRPPPPVERLSLVAGREISLRCGDASITLTRAGKVIVDGRYVLTRSSGCNKIKGAVVDIN